MMREITAVVRGRTIAMPCHAMPWPVSWTGFAPARARTRNHRSGSASRKLAGRGSCNLPDSIAMVLTTSFKRNSDSKVRYKKLGLLSLSTTSGNPRGHHMQRLEL